MNGISEWPRKKIRVEALSPSMHGRVLEQVNTLFPYHERGVRVENVLVLPINHPEEAVRSFRRYRPFTYGLDDLLMKHSNDALQRALPGNRYELFRDDFLKKEQGKIFHLVRGAFHAFPGWPHRHLMNEEGALAPDILEEGHDLIQRVELSYLSLALHVSGLVRADPKIRTDVSVFAKYADEAIFASCLPVGIYIPPPKQPISTVVLAHVDPTS